MADETQILTVEELIALTEKLVPLPLLGEAAGKPRGIRIRKISSREHDALLPPLPPESEDWGKGDGLTDEQRNAQFLDRERAWLRTLPDEKLEQRVRALADLDYRIVALAAIAPKLTVEQARGLGDDARELAVEIKRFSGLVKVKPDAKAEEKKAETTG